MPYAAIWRKPSTATPTSWDSTTQAASRGETILRATVDATQTTSMRTKPWLKAAPSASGRDDLDAVHQRERRDQEDQEHRVRHRDRAELGHADPRQEDRIDHMEDGFAGLREDYRERDPPDHPREPVSRHTDERRSSTGWTLPRRL